MEKIKVTKARRKHIPRIVEMWKDFMDFHAKVDPFYKRDPKAHIGYQKHLEKVIGSRNEQLYIAMDGNDVVGYTYARIVKYPPVFNYRYFGYLNDMYVDPACRRKGLGRMMYKTAIEWFTRRGMKQIELGAVAKNRVAVGFWRKMGFRDRMIRMYKEI